jgi:hypothetical protein
MSVSILKDGASGRTRPQFGYEFPKPFLVTEGGRRIWDADELRDWRRRTVKARREARRF